MRLLGSEQVLAVVMVQFTWIWWPGLAVTRNVDRDGRDTQPNHFRDICAMRAVNIFTHDVLHEEIVHLKVFYTFLHVMGTMGGAKTLDQICCFHARMGGAIPTSFDGLRMLAAVYEDYSDSIDSD